MFFSKNYGKFNMTVQNAENATSVVGVSIDFSIFLII